MFSMLPPLPTPTHLWIKLRRSVTVLYSLCSHLQQEKVYIMFHFQISVSTRNAVVYALCCAYYNKTIQVISKISLQHKFTYLVKWKNGFEAIVLYLFPSPEACTNEWVNFGCAVSPCCGHQHTADCRPSGTQQCQGGFCWLFRLLLWWVFPVCCAKCKQRWQVCAQIWIQRYFCFFTLTGFLVSLRFVQICYAILGDVVAQLVERLPGDPMDSMTRRLNHVRSTGKIWVLPSQNVVLTRWCAQPPCVYACIRMYAR